MVCFFFFLQQCRLELDDRMLTYVNGVYFLRPAEVFVARRIVETAGKRK